MIEGSRSGRNPKGESLSAMTALSLMIIKSAIKSRLPLSSTPLHNSSQILSQSFSQSFLLVSLSNSLDFFPCCHDNFEVISIFNGPITHMQITKSSKLAENRNSTNLSPRLSQKEANFCLNHPKKSATHCLISDQEKINYCEKCSIMLASQGFDVLKIQSGVGSSSRLFQGFRQKERGSRVEEVQSFLREVGAQADQIKQRGMQIQKVLKESQDNYLKVMKDITSFFKQIETVIQIQKYTVYNSILAHRAEVESELRATRESLTIELQSLISMGIDIQNNMEAVETVEATVYQTIMSNYKSKLGISTQIYFQEPGEISFPSCLLGEIPRQIYTISERIELTNHYGPTPSPKRKGQQTPHSAISQRLEEFVRPVSMPCFHEDFGRESQDHEDNYSFDNSTGHMPRILFNERQRKLMPHEVPFRQSLNLTEIRQNQEEMIMRRYASLEETIPEEMQSSRESIDGYLVGGMNYGNTSDNSRLDSRAQETETLLLC